MVSPAKNIAYCFACHTGGGPIRFVQEIEKIEYREALEMLAKEAWVALQNFNPAQAKAQKDLYDLYKRVSQYYHQSLLQEGEGSAPYKYLVDRGLSAEIIERFQIGYSGDSRGLLQAVSDVGYTAEDLVQAGIFVSHDRDKFLSRVIFPICNHIGHPIAFTARTLTGAEPKYLNSPATKIFTKWHILYAYHLAKNAITKSWYAIIVEGQMDAVSLHAHGVHETVAISGSALTPDQVKLLKRITNRIYLSLDADLAGQNATIASIETLMQHEMDIRIITIPNGKDPDDFVRGGGDFSDLIAHAQTAVHYYLSVAKDRYDLSSVPWKLALARDILRLIKPIQSKLEKDIYLRQVADELSLSIESLYEEMRDVKTPIASIESNLNTQKRILHESSWYILASIFFSVEYFEEFFSWFHRIFAYNPSDWEQIPNFWILQKVINARWGRETMTTLSPEESEDLSILSLEYDWSHQSIEKLIDQARPFFVKFAKELFAHKKSQLLLQYPEHSREYLWVFQELKWAEKNCLHSLSLPYDSKKP